MIACSVTAAVSMAREWHNETKEIVTMKHLRHGSKPTGRKKTSHVSTGRKKFKGKPKNARHRKP